MNPTTERICELLALAQAERGVDFIAAALPAPALAVPIAKAAGVTFDCFDGRRDLQVGWAACLVAHERGLNREQTVELLRRALVAERLWSDEQPADRWRAPVHSVASLARLGGQPFFRPHLTACASRLVQVTRHAQTISDVLQKLDHYAEALEAWLAANMPDVLDPPLMPGEELDQLISEFVERRGTSESAADEAGQIVKRKAVPLMPVPINRRHREADVAPLVNSSPTAAPITRRRREAVPA